MADAAHDSPSPHVSGNSKETHISSQDEKKLKKCFLGSIDQGTTSTRFLIFDGTGNPIASHQMEFKQMYPHPGLVNLTIDSAKRKESIDSYAGG